MAGCNAECCKGGVWADPKERDNIMTHAAMIQRHMDAGQEHRPDYWFELQEVKDSDFPSGSAIGTRASETGCVFLKADGKCVLQTTAVAEGMDRFALKPFYCVAYPVSIEYGELTIDDLASRAIQHETDHLHGILFIDRMDKKTKENLRPELEQLQTETKAQLKA